MAFNSKKFVLKMDDHNDQNNAIASNNINYEDNEKNYNQNDLNKDYENYMENPNLKICLPDNDGQLLNILEAAEKGRIELMKQFYKIDPDLINIQDSDGYTPLHRACYNNRIETVKWLVTNGANVCAKTDDGWQPIHCAAQWGCVKVFRILLAYGANINCKTNGANTPFHLAVTRGERNRKLIEYLLFRCQDIDLNARNDADDTPFDICKRNSMMYKLWDLL